MATFKEYKEYIDASCVIASRIKGARKHLGLSIEDLSNKTGVSIRKLTLFESGKVEFYPNDLIVFSKYLKISFEEMFEGLEGD